MGTTQNYVTIMKQAAVLDTLVAQFRAAKEILDAAELELGRAQPSAGHEGRAGRARLALYAHNQMTSPSLTGVKTVVALASEAWAGVS